MRNSARKRRIAGVALGVAFATFVAGAADAALDGWITPTQAQPGDQVTLQTLGVQPDAASLFNGAEVFLVDPGITAAQVCDSANVHSVGVLNSWSGATGFLTFVVPDVPTGTYTFRARVPSSGCWILPTPSLTVIAGPKSSLMPAIGVAAVILVAVVLLVLRRRSSRDIPKP